MKSIGEFYINKYWLKRLKPFKQHHINDCIYNTTISKLDIFFILTNTLFVSNLHTQKKPPKMEGLNKLKIINYNS